MDRRGVAIDTADGACAIDRNGTIVTWNRAAEAILGYSSQEAIGKVCCEVFAGRDPAGNPLCLRGCRVMRRVRQGELVRSFDMASRTKSGRPVWLNVSTLLISMPRRPALLPAVHVFRDVTALRATDASAPAGSPRLASPPAGGDGDGLWRQLSRRELEVLRLIAEGTDTKMLAAQLSISWATARNHVQRLLGKLQVHSRLEAVAYAIRHRLL